MKDKIYYKTQYSRRDLWVGNTDHTPAHFRERQRETSWAHQIATAIVFNSPLTFDGAPPKNIPVNLRVEMIRSLPSVWDETIVLPVSEIGEIAAFARRQSKVWFVAILNGKQARTVKIPLSF